MSNVSQRDWSVIYTYCNRILLILTVHKMGKMGKKCEKRDFGIFLSNYWE